MCDLQVVYVLIDVDDRNLYMYDLHVGYLRAYTFMVEIFFENWLRNAMCMSKMHDLANGHLKVDHALHFNCYGLRTCVVP